MFKAEALDIGEVFPTPNREAENQKSEDGDKSEEGECRDLDKGVKKEDASGDVEEKQKRERKFRDDGHNSERESFRIGGQRLGARVEKASETAREPELG